MLMLAYAFGLEVDYVDCQRLHPPLSSIISKHMRPLYSMQTPWRIQPAWRML